MNESPESRFPTWCNPGITWHQLWLQPDFSAAPGERRPKTVTCTYCGSTRVRPAGARVEPGEYSPVAIVVMECEEGDHDFDVILHEVRGQTWLWTEPSNSFSVPPHEWPSILGGYLAEHTSSFKVIGNTAILQIEDLILACMIRDVCASLVAGLRDAFGLAIERVKYRVRGSPELFSIDAAAAAVSEDAAPRPMPSFEAWEELVGDQVATYVAPIAVDGRGRLVVAARSTAWAQSMFEQKATILAGLQRHGLFYVDVVFRIQKLPARPVAKVADETAIT